LLASIRDHIIAIVLVAATLSAITLWFLADRLNASVTTQDQCYIDTRDVSCLP
jgi:hypothetical protein